MPVGGIGEVYAAGTSVARGYVGEPGATAARFIPDPFGSGARIYRTGDLARWRPEGVLQFVGRIDGQLKVRGMRVEPREIESALSAHPAVRTAVVIAGQRDGQIVLTGYVQVTAPVEDHRSLALALRHRLRRVLPPPMVPAHVICLTEWPVTVNGKIDRARLPEPMPEVPGGERPRGKTELVVAEAWSRSLGCADVRRTDDFFDLGGDSLAAARVAGDICRTLHVDLSPADVLRNPTVSGLANLLEPTANHPATAAPAPPSAMFEHLAGLDDDALARLLAEPAEDGTDD
ncbi:MAG: phosphopantetheine-binding protein [Mycobacteriales bacterium]